LRNFEVAKAGVGVDIGRRAACAAKLPTHRGQRIEAAGAMAANISYLSALLFVLIQFCLFDSCLFALSTLVICSSLGVALIESLGALAVTGPYPQISHNFCEGGLIGRVAAEPVGLQGRLLCFQRQQSRQRKRNRRLCFRPPIRAAWRHSTLGCRPTHPRSDGTFCQALMALSGLRLSQSRPGTLEIRTQKSFLPGVQWPSEYSISAEPPLDVKTCSNSPLRRFIVRYAQYFESPTVRLHSPITSCSLNEPT
jgi:hypothetical protein